MHDLTRKQQAVLRRLQERWRVNGRCPTYRELGNSLRLTLKSVHQHVLALERKGYLTRNGREGIRLSPDAAPPHGTPLYHGRVGAGPAGIADSAIEEHLDLAGDLGLNLPETFLLRVRGESMVKRGIQNGDIVVVRPDMPPGNGDVGAVVLGDDAIVKTVDASKGRLRLFSEPRQGGPREVAIRSGIAPRVCGRVIAALRLVNASMPHIPVRRSNS